MLKLILSSILITTSVLAQDSVMIRDFSGGLNTVSSDFDIQSKYGRLVHNFDLGRNVGALTRRLGYDSVSAVSTNKMDSLKNPFGCYLPDGQQLLMFVVDSVGVRYGEVRSTDFNSNNVGNNAVLANYWGLKYPTTYAMQNGIVFMANGQNRMIAYDALGGKFTGPGYHMAGGQPLTVSEASRPIPPYAPGELEVYPLLDTTGGTILYGDYIWCAIIQDSGITANRRVGYLTPRMRIDSGRAMIRGVQSFFVADTLKDTLVHRYIKLYRTKANPGPVTQFTKLYQTGDSVKFPGGAAFMIDDTPDASLSSSDTVKPSEFQSSNWTSAARPGQPRILSRIAEAGARDTGMARGTQNLKIMKWAWAITFTDTSFNAESDTGMHVEMDSTSIIALNGTDSTRWQRVTLAIPKPNTIYQHMGINVYRAPMYFSVLDTAVKDTMVRRQGIKDTIVHAKDLPDGYLDVRGWRTVTTRDTTIFGPFRKIGHLGPTDSVFVDTFSISQWSEGSILRQNRPPSGINNLISYDGRVFGSAGSRLYMTLLDSGAFAQMRFVSINKDDGDEITAVFPTRRAIRVLKGGSSYNVYQDDGGQWARTEVSSGIGCIAPQSVAHSAAGWYYLSSKGVILENDGPYIERTQATQLISAPLKNFDSLTMAAKRLAVGICADNKYMLCIGDTTYVWDERAQAWGTWSMKFSGATLYGVDANINFVRPDTLYFVQPNSRTLFRYGSSKYDKGANFNMEWRSAPLLLDNRNKVVNALGIWHKSVDTSDVLDFRILNESSTQVAAFADTNLTARYVRLSMPQNLGLGFQIRLLNTDFVVGTGLTRTVIDGIDLYYKDNGKVGE